ncbi:extensin family protein [Variovorax rhizosphaerae]|uniref:Extensin family protein n=1 Tax=Variovorax rhizosphaerae TaxID=1836200 RepID=A0ABU8WYK0_9BURK
MRGRLFATLLVFGLAGAATYAVATGWLAIPDDYNPWGELDAAAQPNLLTSIKLRRAREDAMRCFTSLRQLDVKYTGVPDRDTGPGCGFRDALRMSGVGALKLQPSVILSCRAALSFGMWERHALQPAAREHLGAPLVAVRNLGSYACRDVNTGEPVPEGARRSRHATADAIDIAAFVPAEGRAVTLVDDWTRRDGVAQPGRAPFLRDAHAGACRFFDGVLGPDYNAVHYDHFHLEDGGWRSCR